MPRGDRTGPWGAGPMSGRGAGLCAGFNAPGYANAAPQLGLQRGFCGGGRGWRHWYYATGLPRRARCAPLTKEQELSGLKETASRLQQQLDAINKRIEEMEKPLPDAKASG